MVSSATVQVRRGGWAILERLAVRFPAVALVWVGGGYANEIDSSVLARAKDELGAGRGPDGDDATNTEPVPVTTGDAKPFHNEVWPEY